MKKVTLFLTAIMIATFGFALFACQPVTTQAQPRRKKPAPAPTPSPAAVRKANKKPKWYPNEVEGEVERSKRLRRRQY